jgi:hypothetical protein
VASGEWRVAAKIWVNSFHSKEHSLNFKLRTFYSPFVIRYLSFAVCY